MKIVKLRHHGTPSPINAINQELYVLVYKLPVHYIIFIDVKPQEHNINNVTVTMYTIQLIIDI